MANMNSDSKDLEFDPHNYMMAQYPSHPMNTNTPVESPILHNEMSYDPRLALQEYGANLSSHSKPTYPTRQFQSNAPTQQPHGPHMVSPSHPTYPTQQLQNNAPTQQPYGPHMVSPLHPTYPTQQLQSNAPTQQPYNLPMVLQSHPAFLDPRQHGVPFIPQQQAPPSCLTCQKFKYRCDGQSPRCKNCIISTPDDKMPCTYSTDQASKAQAASNASTAVKRKVNSMACLRCQKKHYKCNNQNPRCDSCIKDKPYDHTPCTYDKDNDKRTLGSARKTIMEQEQTIQKFSQMIEDFKRSYVLDINLPSKWVEDPLKLDQVIHEVKNGIQQQQQALFAFMPLDPQNVDRNNVQPSMLGASQPLEQQGFPPYMNGPPNGPQQPDSNQQYGGDQHAMDEMEEMRRGIQYTDYGS